MVPFEQHPRPLFFAVGIFSFRSDDNPHPVDKALLPVRGSRSCGPLACMRRLDEASGLTL